MRELKDYDIMDIEAMDDERLEKSESNRIQVTRVYIKSDVDKLIKDLKHQRDGAFGLANSGLTLDNLSQMSKKAIDRQKYKRCLAMAEICDARYDEEDAKANGHGASWDYTSKEMKHWERWRQRWLKIADKFKEAN